MKAFFSKWWPSLAHAAALGILFLAPSVQSYIAAHVGQSVAVAAVWGIALHWAQSPSNSSGSKF